MPQVVVVRGRRPGRLLANAPFLAVLDRKLGSSGSSTVVLEFDESARRFVAEAAQVVRAIGRAAQVELAYGPDGGRSAMTEVEVKALARQGAQTSDALAHARDVVLASAALRGSSGRLSAKAIAGAFGLSVGPCPANCVRAGSVPLIMWCDTGGQRPAMRRSSNKTAN